MSVTRAQVVAEARTWLGTRWHHQASLKGVGCDCVGLVRGACLNLGIFEQNIFDMPQGREFVGYSRTPSGATLEAGCAAFMTRIDFADAQVADLVLMAFEKMEPSHVGFLGDYPGGGFSLIHSCASRRQVVESRLDEDLRSKIVSAWQLPSVF